MSTSLKQARDGRLLRLTLGRPEKRNALNVSLCRELVDAFRSADRDREVGAILLDAEGPAFSSGMDLDEVLRPDAAGNAAIHEELFTSGARISKPIVAAVQGAALAGGTGLVANAHIAVAADDARFGLTEMRLALWPYFVFRAVKAAVGERRAVELSLTARMFGAAEALALGLVHMVAPAADLPEQAAAIARRLADASPEAIGGGLDYVRRSRGMNWEEAGRLAAELRARNFASADFTEGIRAFREKRPPRWPSLE